MINGVREAVAGPETPDEKLQAVILERLHMDDRVAVSEISVTVQEGVVTLSGDVDSLIKRTAAARIACETRGVVAIANEIKVRLPADRRRTDVDIAHDVMNALAWDTEVPEKTIKARVQDQWVWLVGECDRNYQRVAAERAVENVVGVKGVVNVVRLKRVPVNPSLHSEIEQALARHDLLSARPIRVTVHEDVRVVLEGTVHSWEERAAAEELAWSAPGVTAVENKLTIIA